MRTVTDPYEYEERTVAVPTVHALKQNKRPIGFAAWSTADEKKPKKRKKKRKSSE